MKRCVIFSTVSLLLALLLPLCAPRLLPRAEAAGVFAWSREEAGEESAAVSAGPEADETLCFPFLCQGELRTVSLAEYLPGVLAGEMPVTFEDEALRAQAVAGRTFVLFRRERGNPNHPEAAVCDDPGCCQVWLGEEALRERWGRNYETYAQRILAAVRDTDGQVLTYEGEPILACFHASSAGYTENCAVVWGASLPYLVSVESPESAEDVPNYVSTVELAPEDFREVILAAYPQAELRESLPPDWLAERALDTSGRVAAIRVGGVAIPGTKMRSLFALRSTHFTLEWTGRSFLFTVTGHGHGAGMSQYGANVMARQGSSWESILRHYYPGTELTGL